MLSFNLPEKSKKKKVRMSLPKALRYVFRSPYLLCISLTVIGYNLAFNLGDVLWKQQVIEVYPNPSDLMAYMNRIMMAIGTITSKWSFDWAASFEPVGVSEELACHMIEGLYKTSTATIKEDVGAR